VLDLLYENLLQPFARFTYTRYSTDLGLHFQLHIRRTDDSRCSMAFSKKAVVAVFYFVKPIRRNSLPETKAHFNLPTNCSERGKRTTDGIASISLNGQLIQSGFTFAA
jgi:hypothetical protein